MLLGYCFKPMPVLVGVHLVQQFRLWPSVYQKNFFLEKKQIDERKHDWLVQKFGLWWLQKLDAIQAEPSFLLLIQKLCLRGTLIPRPVRAIRVTRGGVEPSAIANFPNKLDRRSHIQNRPGRLGTRLLAWWYKLKATGNMLTDLNHKMTSRIPPVQIVRQSLLSFFVVLHTYSGTVRNSFYNEVKTLIPEYYPLTCNQTFCSMSGWTHLIAYPYTIHEIYFSLLCHWSSRQFIYQSNSVVLWCNFSSSSYNSRGRGTKKNLSLFLPNQPAP